MSDLGFTEIAIIAVLCIVWLVGYGLSRAASYEPEEDGWQWDDRGWK